MELTYKLAGLTVNMDTFGFLVDRARPYQIEHTDRPDFTVVGDLEALQGRFTHMNKEFCEYTSMAIDFFEKILDYDGMLLHSSAVVMDGKAYLFSADSGTGKSTHTSLYRRYYGDDRVRILNDDKPVIRLEDGVFYAYGVPWSGKTDMHLNLRVPLGGVCLLERGETNEIEPMPAGKALFRLLQQTCRFEDKTKMEKVMTLMDALLRNVPVWRMKCNMDPEAAKVSYEAMSGKRT